MGDSGHPGPADSEPDVRAAWLADLTAGVLVGVLAVALTISLAVLAFAGVPGPFVAEGIGLALLSTVLIGLVVAATSSLPGMVAHVQDAPVAILAVAAAGLVARAPAGADPRDVFVTVVVANGLTTLFCAVVLLGLGAFRLGRLVRYLPYPVVGGFLAGTGWLLLVGGVGVMSGIPPTWGGLPGLIELDVLARWVPGALLAVAFLVATQRFDHFLVWPGLLLAAVVGFFGVMALAGGSAADWRSAGLLLGPFPEGDLVRTVDYRELGRVHWPWVAGYGGTMVTVAFVCTMAVLFNSTGLELAMRRTLDLNRELRAAGVGNLLAGLGGGFAGYQLLSLTVLSHRVGTGRRRTGWIFVATVAAVIAFGGPLLAFVPTPIVGAVLAYVGLGFLREWVYEAWFKLSRLEYAVILLILAVIAGFGFLQGVGVGVAAALVLFAVSYSRTEVVKHALSGSMYRSRLTRNERDAAALDTVGEMLLILELQGYVFFGTASRLLDRIEVRLARTPAVRYALLDFRQVSGMDATALLGFEKLVQAAAKRDVVLVLTGLAPGMLRQLERSGVPLRDARRVRVFDRLDDGLEWCEDRLLAEGARDPAPSGLAEMLARRFPEPARADDLLRYFERTTIAAGEALMREGDAPDALYFIDSGRVTARLERDGERPVRLQSMHGGSVVGELGFYTGGARAASVVADEETTAYALTADALAKMKRDDPDLAARFHELMVRLLADRVRHLVGVVEALRG